MPVDGSQQVPSGEQQPIPVEESHGGGGQVPSGFGMLPSSQQGIPAAGSHGGGGGGGQPMVEDGSQQVPSAKQQPMPVVGSMPAGQQSTPVAGSHGGGGGGSSQGGR
jgi:hypothetical protein